jgi:hypothetical protein
MKTTIWILIIFILAISVTCLIMFFNNAEDSSKFENNNNEKTDKTNSPNKTPTPFKNRAVIEDQPDIHAVEGNMNGHLKPLTIKANKTGSNIQSTESQKIKGPKRISPWLRNPSKTTGINNNNIPTIRNNNRIVANEETK